MPFLFRPIANPLSSWDPGVASSTVSVISPASPRPSEDLGEEQLEFMSRMLDSMVEFRTSHPELEDRWLDISFYDLVQAPMDMVAHVYDRFGWPLEEEAEAAMNAWLDVQAEQRRSEKRHKYDIADFGLTREKVDAAFSGLS